ncbi:MAG: hypothetical protein HY702_01730 [Gemmatimonadetes bacterium]|nr:hypothetical protein [Gemmatimonadota bacterium]
MTGSAGHRVDRTVGKVRSAYRRRLVAFALAAALVLGLAVVAATWVLAGSGAWRRPTPAPLVLLLLACASWIYLAAWALRRYRAFDLLAAARAVEGAGGVAEGDVRAAVELASPSPGESASLAGRHRWRISEILGRRSPSEALLDVQVLRRLGALVWVATGALAAIAGVLTVEALTARDSLGRAIHGLARPLAYLEPVPLPAPRLVVAAREVRRGSDLAVLVEAEGRDSVALRWRPHADVPATRWLRLAAGRGSGVVPRVEVRTLVWVETPDGARAGPLEIIPLDPFLVSELTLELRPPRYTRRPSEALVPPFERLTVPEGTGVAIRGRANRALSEARLEGLAGAPGYSLSIYGDRFTGRFTARSGRWAWALRGPRSEEVELPPDTLVLEVVRDSAPAVAVLYPGVDTTMSAEMVQPLVIDVRDDYGIARVELVSWRVSTWGERHPPLVEPLAPAVEMEQRVVLEPLLDARERGLFPGDTLRYFVRAWDNAPDPHEGRSREYVLRLPTLFELREGTRVEIAQALKAARGLAEAVRRQAREARAVERAIRVEQGARGAQRARADAGSPTPVDFEATQAAREALEEGERVARRLEEVQRALEEVQRAVERAGLSDPALRERFEELRALYEKVLTPELEARLEELRRALESLDRSALAEAVRRLAETTVDLRDQVERSIRLLERVALEQELKALAAEAKELARTQEELAEVARERAARLDERLERAVTGADSLARRVAEFAERLEGTGEARAAQGAEAAQEKLAASADASRRSRAALPLEPRRATEGLRRAAQAAREAAEQLETARSQMAAAWRRTVEEALARAQREALELAQRESETEENLRSRSEREAARSQVAAIQSGVRALAEALARASDGTLLLDPSIDSALRRADAAMRELLETVGQTLALPGSRPQATDNALEALNELALALMQNRAMLAAGGSGTGFEEALQRLAELAQQQGQLGQASEGLLPLALPIDLLVQRLRQLAEEQRAIGAELERLDRELGGRGEVLGRVDQLGEEARDIAGELERGRLTPELVERQRELFRRLLDAGRSLERDEDVERERKAERPREVRAYEAPPLPASVLQGPKYPRPAQEALHVYPMAYRRLILEYFDALNRGNGSTPPANR